MALPHAASGEPIDVQPLGARLAEAQTVALFKSEQLELIRLVLPAGRSLPPHEVAGEITLQCLEGRLDVELDDGHVELQPGQLLYLQGGARHGVRAIENASALLTIVLGRP